METESTLAEQPEVQACGQWILARKVRAYGRWILVRVEALPEKSGSLYLPQGSFERWEGRAVVESAGRGISTTRGWVPHEVKPGDVVVVARAHTRTSTGERIQEVLGEGYVFIQWNDIMGVIEADEADPAEAAGKEKGT